MDSTCGMNEDWLQRLVWNYRHDEYSFIVDYDWSKVNA